jgi:hypothetical protein
MKSSLSHTHIQYIIYLFILAEKFGSNELQNCKIDIKERFQVQNTVEDMYEAIRKNGKEH